MKYKTALGKILCRRHCQYKIPFYTTVQLNLSSYLENSTNSDTLLHCSLVHFKTQNTVPLASNSDYNKQGCHDAILKVLSCETCQNLETNIEFRWKTRYISY